MDKPTGFAKWFGWVLLAAFLLLGVITLLISTDDAGSSTSGKGTQTFQSGINLNK